MTVSKWQMIYFSALSMIGLLATDMYLPAFKVMEESLSVGADTIALSLSVFLAGLASGQLLWGIAGDKFGQKTVLLLGTIIFAFASLAVSQVTDGWQLLAFRFVQAFGVCAPAVIWQSMVIKRYDSKTSQQIFSTIIPLVSLSPALAPQIGVFMLEQLGWRSIFILLSLIGFMLVSITIVQPKDEIDRTTPRNTKKDIKTLLQSKKYVGNVLMYSACAAAFLAYLTGLPEMMMQLGYTSKDIGLSFVPQTVAFIIGGYGSKYLIGKHGDSAILLLAMIILTIAVSILFVFSQLGVQSILPILIPFCFVALANGALNPIIVNRALSNAKFAPATASGLMNSVQIAVGSLVSAIVASFTYIVIPLTGCLILASCVSLWLFHSFANKADAKHPITAA